MLTVDDVLALQPCSPFNQREHLVSLWNGRETCGVSDFLEMDLTADQKLFVILSSGILSAETLNGLKTMFISRIENTEDQVVLSKANAGSCAEAAHYCQVIDIHRMDNATDRKEAIDTEAKWQLARLIEVCDV